MRTVKRALEEDPELQIILMQRPARFDSMADVSEWSNFVLSCKVEEAKETYGDRLVLGEHPSLHTEVAVEARYGVKILRKAGLGSEGWQVVGGQKGIRRQVISQESGANPTITQNRFEPLN